jgi:TnpA family transposase
LFIRKDGSSFPIKSIGGVAFFSYFCKNVLFVIIKKLIKKLNFNVIKNFAEEYKRGNILTKNIQQQQFRANKYH